MPELEEEEERGRSEEEGGGCGYERAAHGKRGVYTHVHGSVTRCSQRWKRPKGTPADEWTDKMCSVHMVEYCSALKWGDILHRLQHG